MSFSRLKRVLKEKDGSLGAHLRKLEDAGYLAIDKPSGAATRDLVSAYCARPDPTATAHSQPEAPSRSCALIAAGRDSATVTVCARRRQPTSNRQGPRIEAWCLYLRLGYCNLIDYTVRETVHYTEAAVWRRLKAMRLSRETRGVRE